MTQTRSSALWRSVLWAAFESKRSWNTFASLCAELSMYEVCFVDLSLIVNLRSLIVLTRMPLFMIL